MNNEFPKFRITYQNGMTQIKNLINKETYQGIKFLNSRIIEFESQMVGLGRKSKQYKDIEAKIKDIEDIIAGFGEFFVEGSPLHQAISNGGNLILPYSQGGVQKVKVQQVIVF